MDELKQPAKGEKWLAIGPHAPHGFLVKYEHTDSWCDFKAYEVVATSMDGEERFFELKGGKGASDYTTDTDKAESLDGHVKWDGCMNIDLRRAHFCGRSDVAAYGELLSALHELCLMLPGVDRAIADYDPLPPHYPS